MNETDTAPVAEATARRPWEPLGFEKIAASDAEALECDAGWADAEIVIPQA